jgi:trans-aconitate methyltransferase
MTSNQFDAISDDYEPALRHNLRFIPGGIEYYYANRARIARRTTLGSPEIRRILDFGGGIGLAFPHLRASFPDAEVLIYDSSQESVSRAVSTHSELRSVQPHEFAELSCDLVFVAGVVHHVQTGDRSQVLSKLIDCLRPGGHLIIFELNPLNPITRHLVKMCPFDSAAELVSRAELRKLTRQSRDLTEIDSKYIVFFPPALRFLLSLERMMGWLPLGAQYYLLFRKNS